MLVQSNRASEVGYETARGQVVRANAVPVAEVRRNVEGEGVAVVKALDAVNENGEDLFATIENIRQINTGVRLVARFGDPTIDPDRCVLLSDRCFLCLPLFYLVFL